MAVLVKVGSRLSQVQITELDPVNSRFPVNTWL